MVGFLNLSDELLVLIGSYLHIPDLTFFSAANQKLSKTCKGSKEYGIALLLFEQEIQKALEELESFDKYGLFCDLSDEVAPPVSRHLLDKWREQARQKGIPDLLTAWAVNRCRIRLLCVSCVSMKALDDFFASEVRARRYRPRQTYTLRSKGIMRWEKPLSSEAITKWQTRPDVQDRRRCGPCQLKQMTISQNPQWLVLGPRRLELGISCRTCKKVDRQKPGALRPWFRRSKQCLECHRADPMYAAWYALQHEYIREPQQDILQWMDSRSQKRKAPPKIASVRKLAKMMKSLN